MVGCRLIGAILIAVTIWGTAACRGDTATTPSSGENASTDANSSEAASSDAASGKSASRRPTNAKDALEAAARKLNEQSSKVSQSINGIAKMSMQGAIDPIAKKGQLSVNLQAASTRFDIIAINGDVWVKYYAVPAPGISDKWQHIPAAKLKAGGRLDLINDLTGASKLVKSMTQVEWNGDRAFKGTFDLDDKARALPFTATMDGKGRLTSVVVDLTPIAPLGGQLTTSYSDFGIPVTISPPPAADTIEAPESLISKQ